MKNNEGDAVLKFRNYIVNFVRYENYNDFNDANLEFKIDFDINREIEHLREEMYAVSIILNVFPEPKKNNYPFNLQLKLTGYFELKIDDYDLLEQNAIAILFPYARALVSNYTANANIDPLILPPINVVAMLEEKENEVDK
ncbi:MAG: protein-export chaperone SecB [Bacillota bacterium]